MSLIDSWHLDHLAGAATAISLDVRWEDAPIGRQGKRSSTIMPKIDLLKGTLDMLILRVLYSGDQHGWGIADRISLLSKNVLTVGEGSLYPALYRLQDQGWIASEWGTSDNNRRAKFYRLTQTGRKQLEVENETWRQLTDAIAGIV